MFRRLIKRIIDFLGFLSKELGRAYSETWFSDEFYDEVKKRKKINKDTFIAHIANLETLFHGVRSKKESIERAKQLFNFAKKNGDLDELNRLKGE